MRSAMNSRFGLRFCLCFFSIATLIGNVFNIHSVVDVSFSFSFVRCRRKIHCILLVSYSPFFCLPTDDSLSQFSSVSLRELSRFFFNTTIQRKYSPRGLENLLV
ncbi:hypothetical protein F5880DRAFT_868274 [Lentinula raphanica]|nr:hypothetical protein F5880DRAFT_868274 [Lentinula raphanica]